MSKAFPDIQHFQFNYSDKAYLNYKLYKEHVTEFPNCHINLSDIRLTDDTNRAFFRAVYNKFNDDTTQHICNNNTKKESVLLDFKFVNVNIDVKINVDNPADVFNFHNAILTNYPQNYMFYDYIYNAYIELEQVSKNWDVNDDLENVVYRVVDGEVKKFALYENSPIFKIVNSSLQKTVDGSVVNNGDGVSISFDVLLKVPNIIGVTNIKEQRIDGIQIIINGAGNDDALPILIDLNNDVYSDARNKASKIISLAPSDINIELGQIKLNDETKELFYDHRAAVYIVDDSTNIINNINTFFFELGFFEKNSLVDKSFIQLSEFNTKELKDITLNEFSFIEFITFN